MDIVSKEEGNKDEALNEEGFKSMIFKMDLDPFLECFLLKTVSRIISLFREDSFLGTEEAVDVGKRDNSSLQEDIKFE